MPDTIALMDEGDEARRRFEVMWAAHHPAVLAYARRRAPAEVADELAAETFAVAWRRLHDVPDDAGPWLLGVARRVLANRRRGARRAGALLARLGAQPWVAAPDPADLVGGDRGLREAFATVLGVPAAMASARIHRARGRLRRALDARESVAAEGAP
jgi:RNA polymerase sigma-70 factor (ECF subfamily)